MINVSKKKKILILLLILVLLFFILRYAYSKYVNQVNISKDMNIAQWNIKINDQDITQDTHEFLINDFTWNEERHVQKPKVAPGMQGYFNLKVDTTGTQVSIKYTIEIDESKLREISDINLRVTGLEEDGVKQEMQFDEDGKIIIETIKKLDEIKSDPIDNLRLDVVWENLDTEEGNKNDSKASEMAGTKIQMPIKINVIQYLSN